MKKTGELLKSTRESKNLSLHEIGMSLKINPKILQAIEEGDITRLPPKTFLRGFVKSYAQFLKLDGKAVLDSFDRETNPLIDPATDTLAEEPSPFMESKRPQTSNFNASTSSKLSERAPSHIDRSGAVKTQRTLMTVGGVILVAVIVIVARTVNKYQKERDQGEPRAEIVQPTTLAVESPSGVQARTPNPPATTTAAAVAITPTATTTEAPVAPPVSAATPPSAETTVAAKVEPAPVEKKETKAAVTNAAPTETPSLFEKWTSSLLTLTKPAEPAASQAIAAKPAEVPAASSAPPAEKMAEKPAEEKPVEKIQEKAPEKIADKATEKPVDKPKDKVPEKSVDKVVAAATPDVAAKSELKSEADEEKAAAKGKSQEVIIEASGKVQVSYTLGGGSPQSVELNADDVHTFKSKSSIALDISDGDAVSLIVNGMEKGKPGKAGQAVHVSYPK
jgi:cytoskeleton protein RodZ